MRLVVESGKITPASTKAPKDSGGGRSQDRVVLVQHWTEDVKRLVPTH